MSAVTSVQRSVSGYSFSLRNIPQNLAKIAGIATAIFMIANVQRADGGPLAYAACLTACSAATLGGFLPACAVACAPTLAAPTP